MKFQYPESEFKVCLQLGLEPLPNPDLHPRLKFLSFHESVE